MILLLVTGGTFDKTYDHVSGKLFFEHTHIPKMLERSRCHLDVDIKPLMLKDSLELTPNDLDRISEACKKSTVKSIVITHGTDRMVETASHLAQLKLNKTIILTGAMIPYAFGSSSDGFFNLGCALSFAQSLKNGVYITMQGQFFNPNNVVKNNKEGFFKTIN